MFSLIYRPQKVLSQRRTIRAGGSAALRAPLGAKERLEQCYINRVCEVGLVLEDRSEEWR